MLRCAATPALIEAAIVSPSSPRPSGLCSNGMKPRQWQERWILVQLQSLKTGTRYLAQVIKVEAKGHRAGVLKAADAFPQQHRGSSAVAALQMQMGHGNLQDSLKHTPAGSLGLMPEILKSIVAGVPLSGIEKPDGFPKAGVGHQAVFLRTRGIQGRG